MRKLRCAGSGAVPEATKPQDRSPSPSVLKAKLAVESGGLG